MNDININVAEEISSIVEIRVDENSAQAAQDAAAAAEAVLEELKNIDVANKLDKGTYTGTAGDLKEDIDLRLKITDYNDRFKGKFVSEAALVLAHPTANSGDYAIVDLGVAEDAIEWIWDTESGWIEGGSKGALTTDELVEGSTNLYFKTARVLATVLSGLSFLVGGPIVSTDSVIVAFGKLQRQINDLFIPDTVICTTEPTRVGNEFTFPVDGYEVLLNKNRRSNTNQLKVTPVAATTDYKRVDLVYFKPDNTLDSIQGIESTSVAVRPEVPVGSIAIYFINVFGATIEAPTPIDKEISIQDSNGVQRFPITNYLRFRGVDFNDVTKEIIIESASPFTIFIDTVIGNDFTAQVENKDKPFKTLQKAYDAIPTSSVVWTLLFIDNNVIRDMSAPFPSSNKKWKIECFTSGVFDFSNKVLSTTYTENMWIDANINIPKSTLKIDLKGTAKCFITTGVATDSDINIIANRIEVTSSIPAAGAGVRGMIHTAGSCFITTNNLYTNYTVVAGSADYAPIVLANDGFFKINKLWQSPVTGSHVIIFKSKIVPNNIEIYIASFIRGDFLDSFSFANSILKKITIGNIEGVNSLYIIKVISSANSSLQIPEVVFNNSVVKNTQLSLLNSAASGTFIFSGRIINDVGGVVRFYNQGNSNMHLLLTNFDAKVVPREYNNSKTTLRNVTLTFDNELFTDNTNPSSFKTLFNGQVNFEGSNTLTSLNSYEYLFKSDKEGSVINIKGATYTNCKAFGKNITAIYELSTFKEESKKTVIRYKSDLLNRVLDSNTTYVVDGNIILLTGEYIEIPLGGLTFAGYGFDVSKLTKNVAGESIFKSPVGGSGNLVTHQLTCNSGLSSVFDIVDSNGTHAIEMNDFNFENCSSIGKIKGYRQFTGHTIGMYGCSDGFKISGTWNGFLLSKLHVIGFATTGTLFKKDTDTTFSNRFSLGVNISGNAGFKIADFDNTIFAKDETFQLDDCTIEVDGIISASNTPSLIPNISPNDPKCRWVNSTGIQLSAVKFQDIKSPDGSIWRLTVNDLGAPTWTELV